MIITDTMGQKLMITGLALFSILIVLFISKYNRTAKELQKQKSRAEDLSRNL